MIDKPHPVSLATPVLFILIVVLSFAVGMLWTKVQMLEGGQSGQATPKIAAANPGQGTVGGEAQAAADNLEKLRENDHFRGSKDSRILLIEYSDLECPFCKKFHETAKEIIKEYDGKVGWIYRHFPIDSLHSKADKEAEAVECAAEIGGEDGFWKLVDKIYEVTPSNNGLDHEKLPGLVKAIGVDVEKFKSCLASSKHAKYVEDDYHSGVKAGVTGTPGNFLFDTKTGRVQVVRGALPFEQIKPMIDSLLQES